MGTNFYAYVKDPEMFCSYGIGEQEYVKEYRCELAGLVRSIWDEDAPDVVSDDCWFRIHLGKRAAGWKPTFAWHPELYTSRKEMEAFIRRHADDVVYMNDYRDVLSPEEIIREFLYWAERQTPHMMRYDENIKSWVEDDENGYLRSPFDHIEYQRYAEPSIFRCDDLYISDDEGHNFMKGDFS